MTSTFTISMQIKKAIMGGLQFEFLQKKQSSTARRSRHDLPQSKKKHNFFIAFPFFHCTPFISTQRFSGR